MNTPITFSARGRLGLTLLLAAANGCAVEPARAAPDPPPRAVHVARADRSSRPVVTELVGSVRAVRSTTIAALVSGTVAEVRAGMGRSVRAGEVLVTLSAREIDARLEQARAMAALADPERDRAVHLMHQQAISTAQYDAAMSQWNIAQARQAEANAIAAHTSLRAPFAGVITAKLANVGDVAMPGQALLQLEALARFASRRRCPRPWQRSGWRSASPCPSVSTRSNTTSRGSSPRSNRLPTRRRERGS